MKVGKDAPRDRRARGASSIAQTVIVAPALLLALMLIVQIGLSYHARNVAENAAQTGVAAARRFDGTEADGQTSATQYLASMAGRTLLLQSVDVSRTAESATAIVRGTVVSLVPGLHLSVEEQASGPVERFVSVPPSTGGREQ